VVVVVVTDADIAVLRFVIQLSRDYQPSHVTVVAYDSKLRVVARQEVTSSAGVTSRREFTRELDVTRAILRCTLRAALERDVDVTRLWIAAAVMTSSSSSAAAAAAAAVDSVLPSDALPCCVELR